MRIALLLLSVFICWQMVATGPIEDPPPPPKYDKDKDDGKKDKHSGDCCDDKKPEPKDKGEWKKKGGHSSEDHADEKHGTDLSVLEHLAENNPLVDKLSGEGLGGILHLTSGKSERINLSGLKKLPQLFDYLPGKMIGGAIGSKGGKGRLDLKSITGKIPLIKSLPLKGILGGSDYNDDDDKTIHEIKRRGLTDDWISTGKDWKGKGDDDILELDLDKNGKDWSDSKPKNGKSEDARREKNWSKSDRWKVNNNKEGQWKGGWTKEQKKKDVRISVVLKDKKDSASWSDEWKSKDWKKGNLLKDSWTDEWKSKDSWNLDKPTTETPCDED